jgi:3-oxoacyl-[acyl-carrier-protein] synthase-1
MSPFPRIAITGSSAVCGAGLQPAAIFDAILEGRSAIGPIQYWDMAEWPIQVAAQLTGVKDQVLVEDRKLHKSVSRTDLFGIYAGDQAIQSSGFRAQREALPETDVPGYNDRSGLVVGSGGGCYQFNYDFFPLMTASGGDLVKFGTELSSTVHPMWLLRILPNNVLCHVGIRNNFKGTNACITNQCASGAMAVVESAASLRTGEADRIVAIAHDTPIEPEVILGYHNLGLLSADAVRTFDRQRGGTVFGEGAAGLAMEPLESAVARGAEILGEFLGSGCVTEATGIVQLRPDGDGPERAIRLALAEAGISPQEVGMIVAHGNGTRNSDASEATAILRVFGCDAPPVTAFKWAIGHTLAAAGTLDAVLALEALRRNVVPGIPTLHELDPEFAGLPASPEPCAPRSGIALVICRGFGGMNVAIVLKKGGNS